MHKISEIARVRVSKIYKIRKNVELDKKNLDIYEVVCYNN